MSVLLQIGHGPPPEAEPPGPHAEFRLFRSMLGDHLLVVDGSRIYDLPPAAAQAMASGLEGEGSPDLWRALGLFDPDQPTRRIDSRPLDPPPLASLSLNVMQACNMSCVYCYADEGRFGGRARMMTPAVGRAAVDRLLADSAPGTDLVLGFLGGEPLLARELVHELTRYAAVAATAEGRRIRFSLTTNLSTVQPEDARLFADFPFSVSVSLDGRQQHNDSQRRMRDGSSAYQRVLRGLAVLERHGRPRHLAARVTVTPTTGRLLPILEHLIGLDFDEVGFAAVLAAPDQRFAFDPDDFPVFLGHMVECGEAALGRLKAGERYPFGNFETAMYQLHRGTHRPYPCGGGAGYLSASAEGALFTCHRLIDDDAHAMGDLATGPDHAARAAHLARSHVDRMEPCRGCWARYLCGGGCYHEVARRGRIGCDYIRGWLDFCLRAYVELAAARPDYFAAAPTAVIGDPTTLAR